MAEYRFSKIVNYSQIYMLSVDIERLEQASLSQAFWAHERSLPSINKHFNVF